MLKRMLSRPRAPSADGSNSKSGVRLSLCWYLWAILLGGSWLPSAVAAGETEAQVGDVGVEAADRKADVGQNPETASPAATKSNSKTERQTRATAKQTGEFKPSEEISEDYSVSFPVDI